MHSVVDSCNACMYACSPCLFVTNHEGQLFPIVKPATKAKQAAHGHLTFDRILCDVPCSGDGTLRKAPDIWRRWTPHNGNSLHCLQLRITLQACRLLKVGGRLVYSTCTFNPVEDEAVVAATLEATQGAMRLIDVSADMPDLKRLPGIKTWQVRRPLEVLST
jgi:16S rRNA C967 or C1407 C5-methylase (RsmB/RsmF family)